ncbi:MAG: hypothetical protein C0598_05785 [Marinilabiliales bacterium]|nr:MAG: hypothetical protein C0598_05785 [Marinilabiliales bacterium]
MKGIVFTEFIEYVEDKHGFDVTQNMIDGSGLSNEGVFTSVGTYDASEFVSMVTKLSELTNNNISSILNDYGKYLFKIFSKLYPHFFPSNITIFDFISKIDSYIHVEVKKLYPDAELPKMTTLEKNENMMIMKYSSARKFSDFAHGLLLGAVDFFNENIEIQSELISNDGSEVKFTLIKKG